MAKHIVVTGATGHIGSKIVHHLLEAGHRVTAASRASERLDALQSAGAEIRPLDLTDTAGLTDALRGADAAFLLIPPNMTTPDFLAYGDEVGESVATAVRDSGLKQVVNLSSVGAEEEDGRGPVRTLYRQEARLNAIDGLSVVHLRPGYFMENQLSSVGMIHGMGILGSSMRADVAVPMIDTRDIAARAADLLSGGVPDGQTVHPLLGPKHYTMNEVATAIGAAIGRPDLAYVQFPYDQAVQGMIGAGLSPSIAGLFDEMTRNINDEKIMVHEPRTAERTTPTTIEAFARDTFAPAFNGA